MPTEHQPNSKKSWILPGALLAIAIILIAVGFFYRASQQQGAPETPVTEASPSPAADPLASPSPDAQVSPQPSGVPTAPASVAQPDLTVDAAGLSKSTVVIQTNKGVVKFKFYPSDAPTTVGRLIELIKQGFYNGLSFHRVVPGFVVQGGDPNGNGTGGSGQKLKAEFNKRRHVEGAVAMARAADPDSADSQFYISLGTHPHLDNNYTVFGQVVEGMDVVRKLEVGDRMTTVHIE